MVSRKKTSKTKIVYGEELLMSKKAYGTSYVPMQTDLRWNCDTQTAERM